MTLVTSINDGSGYAIMTTDIREVIQGYWYDTATREYTRADETALKISEEKATKVRFLSNYSMVGVGGVAEISRYVSAKLVDLVQETDDLHACGAKLVGLIDSIRNDSEAPSYASFLNKENGMVLILNGFYRDGRSGLVVYESGPDAEVQFLPIQEDQIRWAMIPPEEEYKQLGYTLTDGVTGLNHALNKAITLHAQISLKEQIKVSPECEYFVLFRDENGQVTNFEGEFDTSAWHEQLKQLQNN